MVGQFISYDLGLPCLTANSFPIKTASTALRTLNPTRLSPPGVLSRNKKKKEVSSGGIKNNVQMSAKYRPM